MVSIRSVTIIINILLAALPGVIFGQSQPPTAAVVNGQSIALWEAERELSGLIGSSRFHRSVDPERLVQLRRQALDTLIRKELRAQWAAAAGREVDEAEVQRQWEKVRKRFPDESSYRSALSEKGIEHEAFLAAFRRDVIAAEVERAQVTSTPVPSAAEIASHFEANRSDYVQPEARNLVLALFYVPPSAPKEALEAARELAEGAAESVRSGAVTIEEAAQARAGEIPPKYRDQNGSLGFIHRGALGEPLDEPVFAAKVDTVIGPVRTLLGYHIAEVTAIRAPRPLELDSVQEAISAQLLERHQKERLDRFDATLKAAADIQEGPWAGSR